MATQLIARLRAWRRRRAFQRYWRVKAGIERRAWSDVPVDTWYVPYPSPEEREQLKLLTGLKRRAVQAMSVPAKALLSALYDTEPYRAELRRLQSGMHRTDLIVTARERMDRELLRNGLGRARVRRRR